MPIIKVGRMAGQFAKPRSEPDEVKSLDSILSVILLSFAYCRFGMVLHCLLTEEILSMEKSSAWSHVFITRKECSTLITSLLKPSIFFAHLPSAGNAAFPIFIFIISHTHSHSYADISRLHAWNLDFVENLPAGSRYREMCSKVDESLRFMKAIGVDTRLVLQAMLLVPSH